MDDKLKEVDFNKYCPTCKYNQLDISGDPTVERDDNWKGDKEFFHDKDRAAVCHECLNNPGNWNSHKPVNYEEAE